MQLGELEGIFEAEPEGSPLDPQWIEADPDTAEPTPATPAEPGVLEPAKVDR
jgi:hypothetical protein